MPTTEFTLSDGRKLPSIGLGTVSSGLVWAARCLGCSLDDADADAEPHADPPRCHLHHLPSRPSPSSPSNACFAQQWQSPKGEVAKAVEHALKVSLKVWRRRDAGTFFAHLHRQSASPVLPDPSSRASRTGADEQNGYKHIDCAWAYGTFRVDNSLSS